MNLNEDALDARKPKIDVLNEMNPTARLLDSQLLDKQAQEIWFLDVVISRNEVPRAS